MIAQKQPSPASSASRPNGYSLDDARRDLRAMPLSRGRRNFILRAFQYGEGGPRHLESKVSILAQAARANPRGEGVVLYPGAFADIEHAILLPARNYVLVDPSLMAEKELFSVVEKIRHFANRAEMILSHQGLSWKVHVPASDLTFVLCGNILEDFEWKRLPLSGFIVKKPVGSLAGIAGDALLDASRQIRPGGSLLYCDMAERLEDVDRKMSSYGFSAQSNGELSCHVF
ncbi:MAG: hypothetical protein KGH63_04820, partial [Candidatus Micrarchaeota archaeon]|nr:hypothetical protein [Candidatus Micrarchaeota archaeon]